MHNILTGDHGLRIAVFMNEYGEEQDLERQMLSKHEVRPLQSHDQLAECMEHIQSAWNTERPCIMIVQCREKSFLLWRNGWNWQMDAYAAA